MSKWKKKGKNITETKKISLDYGNFLSKFEISISGTTLISTGITLHYNDGKTQTNLKEGWIDYWQPLEDSEIGTGVVFPKFTGKHVEKYLNPDKDLCNLYVDLKVKKNKVTYYAGFGWKKQGEYTSKESWEKYLGQFANKIDHPLRVKIN